MNRPRARRSGRLRIALSVALLLAALFTAWAAGFLRRTGRIASRRPEFEGLGPGATANELFP